MNGNRIWIAPMGALALALSLTGCGGSGDGSASDGGESGGGGSGGTSTGNSTCTGGSRTATSYDVFLNTAAGIAPSSVSRNAQLYGGSTDAGQCILVAASSAQGDAAAFQVATTDGWNNAITYADPTGTAINGGVRFNQGLIVTCASGSDTFKHVAILNPGGGASTLVASNPSSTVVKGTPLVNYECTLNDSSSTPQINGASTVTFSSTDGSATLADGSNGTTTFAAADVASLFGAAGYTLSGKILHWALYQLPVGSGTKQVLVHTSQRSDGTVNVDLFLVQ